MEEPNNLDQFGRDPLLKPGAFIDPTPTPANGVSKLKSPSSSSSATVDPDKKKKGATSNVMSKRKASTVDPAAASVDDSQPLDQKDEVPVLEIPDWLPPGWAIIERVRSKGASAGSRDKYYVEPGTQRRFRSKKEVLYYIETGTPKKKKIDEADGGPVTGSGSVKRKKSESKAKNSVKNFNFDDVPSKVKWALSDVYEGTWRPLTNGVDRVPESSKQEWAAAFTYLTLQNGGGPALF